MAIDTANKRASVLGIALPLARILPTRDGAVDPDEFEQLALSYAGIQAASPIPVPTAIRFTGERWRRPRGLRGAWHDPRGTVAEVLTGPSSTEEALFP